jgi:hypothetical protein
MGFFTSVVVPAIASGLFHVVIGPDHLTAIMTLSVCERSAAFWQGIRWGIGHSFGIGIVAILVWILGSTLSTEAHNKFDFYGSLISGIFMILLGLHFLRKVSKKKSQFIELAESRPLTPSPQVFGLQADKATTADESHDVLSVSTISLLAGIITGAAGPGGMLAVMPASYYSTYIESISYILLFMVSSTLAMGAVALIYGNLTFNFALKNKNSDKLVRGTYLFSSSLSIVLGVVWIALTLTGVLGSGH